MRRSRRMVFLVAALVLVGLLGIGSVSHSSRRDPVHRRSTVGTTDQLQSHWQRLHRLAGR
ncbi:MAG: hypothetical protein GX977_13140 [Firmicutes bacterium]|nr:hypothetical protein [Bacillota bacterium]